MHPTAEPPRRVTPLGWACVGLVSAALVLVVAVDWTNVFVVPLAIVPPIAIAYFVYWRWLRRIQNQDDLFLRMFAFGFLPGAALVMIAEIASSGLFAFICLRDQLKAVMEELTPGNQPSGEDPYSPRPMPDLTFDAGMFFFVFLTAYVTAATIEEIMKAMAVRYSTGCSTGCTQVRKDTPHPRQLAYATTALLIAVSLGFSTVENLLYIFGASLSAGSTPSLSSVGAKCLLALVRGCISMPIHCLCVAFTALRLTLRDVQRDRVDLLQQAARGDGIFKWHAFASSGDVTGTSSTQRPEAADAGTFVTAFPATALRPSAEGEWVRVLSAASASTEAASIRVWGWPKVLWPAIAVHGTFDFQAMLLGALLYKDMSTASLTALTLVLGVTVQLVSLWILRQQYKGVFERIANNDLPGLTWKVHWVLCGTPPALPSLSNFGGTDNGGDDSFAPIPMSSGSVEAGGRAPWLDAREGERQPLTVPA